MVQEQSLTDGADPWWEGFRAVIGMLGQDSLVPNCDLLSKSFFIGFDKPPTAILYFNSTLGLRVRWPLVLAIMNSPLLL